MSLISMAVFDTEENQRSELTEKTLYSLFSTVDFDRHRLFIVDNGSCDATLKIYGQFKFDWAGTYPKENLTIILKRENLGTAKAVNKGWVNRKPGENCIKIDNDVVIHQEGWVDLMDEAIAREPQIGQVGLKRKDCWEYPGHENAEWRSKLHMLPHKPGEKWIVVEQAKHIIGTCVMHSAALLDKVGYLYQPSLYGYDDVLMSWRSSLSGFFNCFLPHIEIDHIDPGTTEYQGWKERHSGEQTKTVVELVNKFISKEQSLYYEA